MRRPHAVAAALLFVFAGCSQSQARGPDARPTASRGAPPAAAHPTPPGVPDGPRFVVAEGRFDEGKWASYQGKEWRLLAWGEGDTHCFQLQIGAEKTNSGLSCSTPAPGAKREFILGRTVDPGGPGGVMTVTHGEVAPEVAEVEFRLTSGDVVRVETLPPPDEAPMLAVRYYVAFLPWADNGQVVAFDAEGNELETKDLCHAEGCGGRPR